MRINVPYFKQPNWYLCGPASLKMVLAFLKIKYSQTVLIKKLGLSISHLKRFGTPNQSLEKFIKTEGLFGFSKKNSSLKDIKKIIKAGLPVIVNYIEPSDNEGHYAVVTGYAGKKLILNDPWNGKNFKINQTDFTKRWHGQYSKSKHWLLVLSNKLININNK